MNKKIIPLLLAGSSLLVACDGQNNTSTTATQGAAIEVVSKEDAIAVVNGKYISKEKLAILESEIAQRRQGQAFPREKLIDELVQRELLIQEANKKQLANTAEFKEQISNVRQSLLTQAAVQNYLKSNPITDAALEAEYKTSVKGGGSEYKARHILVKTEDAAKAIIKDLDGGADFIELAKTKSTGPSGPKGGDLGWFAEGQMVAPFSAAVVALENNKYTTEAVKTQFGWHVILREDSRSPTPPPFESVKEQIRPMLQRKKMQEFLDGLRKQASIEIFTEENKSVAVAAPAKAVNALEQAILDAKNKAVDATGKMADGVKEGANKAVESVPTTDSLKQAIIDAKDKAVNTGSKAVDGVRSEATTKSKEAMNAFQQAIANAKNKAVDAGNKAVDSVKTEANKAVTDSVQKIKDTVTK